MLKPRERGTGTRSAPTHENHSRRGARGISANRHRTPDTPDLAAHGQSVSRKTIAEVPLTGLSSLVSGGLLEMEGSIQRWVRMAIDTLDARSLDVDHNAALEAYALPGRFHKDPADRLLVATARLHKLTLITADEQILAYKHVRKRDART